MNRVPDSLLGALKPRNYWFPIEETEDWYNQSLKCIFDFIKSNRNYSRRNELKITTLEK